MIARINSVIGGKSEFLDVMIKWHWDALVTKSGEDVQVIVKD